VPVPTTYTEVELATFMRDDVLRNVATLLGWTDVTPSGPYNGAIVDTLTAYGVPTIAAATDIPKLRILARVAVWQAVVATTAAFYAVTDVGVSTHREQIQAQALVALRHAERAARAYLPRAAGATSLHAALEATW
jgi:hypothetical protein